MKKTILSAIIIAVVIIGGLGSLASYYLFRIEAQDYLDFETEYSNWNLGYDVPLDPNNPGNYVNWSIARVENASRSFSGTHSLKLFIDGRQDDGTIWIERSFEVEPNKKYRVSISFKFYCGMESFNTITQVITYCNVTNPEIEDDLIEGIIGSGEQALEWKDFSRKLAIVTESENALWVAIGMSVVWETEITHYIDDLKITIR